MLGKTRGLNQLQQQQQDYNATYMAVDGVEFVETPLITIQQTTLHKSPSPRGRQIKMQHFGPGGNQINNSTTLQVNNHNINQLVPAQGTQNHKSRTQAKENMKTDPKKNSAKANDVNNAPPNA